MEDFNFKPNQENLNKPNTEASDFVPENNGEEIVISSDKELEEIKMKNPALYNEIKKKMHGGVEQEVVLDNKKADVQKNIEDLRKAIEDAYK